MRKLAKILTLLILTMLDKIKNKTLFLCERLEFAFVYYEVYEQAKVESDYENLSAFCFADDFFKD